MVSVSKRREDKPAAVPGFARDRAPRPVQRERCEVRVAARAAGLALARRLLRVVDRGESRLGPGWPEPPLLIFGAAPGTAVPHLGQRAFEADGLLHQPMVIA